MESDKSVVSLCIFLCLYVFMICAIGLCHYLVIIFLKMQNNVIYYLNMYN